MAIRAARMLRNGTGGLDWAGLPLVAAHLGITDPEAVLDALEVLITHEAPDAADGTDAATKD